MQILQDLQRSLPLAKIEKARTPVLVLDAFQLSSFLLHQVNGDWCEKDKTFLVAFPEFDIS